MSNEREDAVVVVERQGGGQVMAFLIGLAVGAGAALLFAPQSGAETRADIARQARKARRTAERVARDVRQRAGDAIDHAADEVRDRATAARDEAARRYAGVKRDVEDAIDDVRLRVDASRDAGRAAAKAARDELQRRLADARAARDEDATV